MIKNTLLKLAIVIIGISGINSITYGQSTYKIKKTDDVDIKIKGTSTLHDWEMDAFTCTGSAQFEFDTNEDKALSSIKTLSFALQVADLKSDSDGLNTNAYAALKSETYKEIRFKLTSAIISPEKGGYVINSKGKLTIAGVTKNIELVVYGLINSNGTLSFLGSYKLNMTDFDVVPPVFMWGAMKTGDAITLNFNIVFEK